MKCDFIVLSTERSGSHMIASMLDGHPEISCVGNFRGKPRTRILGYLIKYRTMVGIISIQRVGLAEPLIWEKVIHLTRNPVDAATAQLRNEMARADAGAPTVLYPPRGMVRKKFKGSRLRHEPLVQYAGEPSVGDVNELSTVVSWERRKAVEMVEYYGWPMFEVSYESITGGRDTKQMPADISQPLLSFLGAKDTNRILSTKVARNLG